MVGSFAMVGPVVTTPSLLHSLISRGFKHTSRGICRIGAAGPISIAEIMHLPQISPGDQNVRFGIAQVAGRLPTMFMKKGKVAGVALVLVLGTGAAVTAYQAVEKPPAKAVQSPIFPSRANVASPSTPANDVTDWVAGWPDLTNPREDVARNKPVLEALEMAIPMHFPQHTQLSDVITYVRKATEGPGLPKGLIIYVDPIGMQDADRTTLDAVTMDLEGLPLKISLRLLLKQLSLAYTVSDGLLTITSTGGSNELCPFTIMLEKARRGELGREQYRQLIEALRLRNEVQALAIGQASRPGKE